MTTATLAVFVGRAWMDVTGPGWGIEAVPFVVGGAAALDSMYVARRVLWSASTTWKYTLAYKESCATLTETAGDQLEVA